MGVFAEGFLPRRTARVALVLGLLALASPAAASEMCELRSREARAALRSIEDASRRGDVSGARRHYLRMRSRLQGARTACPDDQHEDLARIELDGVAAFEEARSVAAELRAREVLEQATNVDVGREAGSRLGLPEWNLPANQPLD